MCSVSWNVRDRKTHVITGPFFVNTIRSLPIRIEPLQSHAHNRRWRSSRFCRACRPCTTPRQNNQIPTNKFRCLWSKLMELTSANYRWHWPLIKWLLLFSTGQSCTCLNFSRPCDSNLPDFWPQNGNLSYECTENLCAKYGWAQHYSVSELRMFQHIPYITELHDRQTAMHNVPHRVTAT